MKYPKHPNPPHRTSDFPLGHRGCYLCGDAHVFRDCPRNKEPRALQKMRFNMHYYQPKMYFRIQRGMLGPSQPHQSYTQHHFSLNTGPNYDLNKRVRIEQPPLNTGFDRGNGTTLPAWLVRQSNDQHDSSNQCVPSEAGSNGNLQLQQHNYNRHNLQHNNQHQYNQQ